VLDHGGDQRARAAHPVGQHRAVDRHPMPGHHHGLPIKRHVLGMLGDGDLGKKCLGRPTAFQQMRGSLGLHHARAPLRARIFRAHRDDHLIACGDVVQPLGFVLADADHVAAAAGTGNAVGLDHPLDAWQALRQCPRLARCARRGLVRIGRAGRDLLLDRRNLRLGLGDGRFQIFQRQFQLRRIQLFRFRPELRAAVVSDLAFQLLDQRLQLGDEGVLLGHHRLLVLPRRTLDRKLELQLRNRLNHLGRQAWKLAEIKGLRHAAS
jgi:hypothetical protein